MALIVDQQLEIIEDIVYLFEDFVEILELEVVFFDLLWWLVIIGYFISKEGIKDLGYKGNVFNFWDGLFEEVL